MCARNESLHSSCNQGYLYKDPFVNNAITEITIKQEQNELTLNLHTILKHTFSQ